MIEYREKHHDYIRNNKLKIPDDLQRYLQPGMDLHFLLFRDGHFGLCNKEQIRKIFKGQEKETAKRTGKLYLERVFYSDHVKDEIEIDEDGKISVPSSLRKRYFPDGNVIIGERDGRIEIWDSEKYLKHSENQALLELAQNI